MAAALTHVGETPRSNVVANSKDSVTVKTFRLRSAHMMQSKIRLEAAAGEWLRANPITNVQKLIRLCPTQSPMPGIVAEYIGPNVMDYLANRTLNETKKCLIMHDVALALTEMHSWEITHGNIKGSNILINGAGRPYITDIGVHDAICIPGEVDTSRWKAPERVLDPTVPRRKESDVWSFAMTVLEVVTERQPFPHLLDANIPLAMSQNLWFPARPNGISDGLWQLLSLCWKYRPADRVPMAVVAPGIRFLVESTRRPNF